MFWNKKNSIVNQNKTFDLNLDINKQAIINIIKLGCPYYINDSEVLQNALTLGLKIMEDLATQQAEYKKVENNKTVNIVLPNK